MSAMPITSPLHAVNGLGWRAEITPGLIHLAVHPDGDVLPDAIDALMVRQESFLLTHVGMNDDGWDLYELEACVTAS